MNPTIRFGVTLRLANVFVRSGLRLAIIIPILFLIGLASCDKDSHSANRWYTQQQVDSGAKVFANQCASCHGKQAEGNGENWKVRLKDGSYLPPPLNGSAHAWHHSLPLLLQIVQQGGALFDGKMPGFSSTLSEAEQYAVIAWFQSLWSDETYRLWQAANSPPYPPVQSSQEQSSD